MPPHSKRGGIIYLQAAKSSEGTYINKGWQDISVTIFCLNNKKSQNI